MEHFGNSITDFSVDDEFNQEVLLHRMVDEGMVLQTPITSVPAARKDIGRCAPSDAAAKSSDDSSDGEITSYQPTTSSAAATSVEKRPLPLVRSDTEEEEGKPAPKKRRRQPAPIKMPPPPFQGHTVDVVTPPSSVKVKVNNHTLGALLTYLAAIFTLPVDAYASAYAALQKLEGSKAPRTAVRTVASVMNHWHVATQSLQGKQCCLSYLQENLEEALCARSMLPRVWDTVKLWFEACCEPRVTGSTHSDAPSPRPRPMTRPLGNTSTPSTTSAGTAAALSPAGTDGPVRYRSRVNRPTFQNYQDQTLVELQSTFARDNGTLYTCKSAVTSGSTIVKLEIYNRAEVDRVPRTEWWKSALFRGTIITENRRTVEAAMALQESMECELEERPGTQMYSRPAYSGPSGPVPQVAPPRRRV